jgi:hypothetical protein
MLGRNVGIVLVPVVGTWVLINILATSGLPRWAIGISVDIIICLVIGAYSGRTGQRVTPSVAVVIGIPMALILIAPFLTQPIEVAVETAGVLWYVIGVVYLNKIRPRPQADKAPAST